MSELNAVTLLQELIKCPSVTPTEGGALQYLEDVLKPLGFKVERIVFSEDGQPDVENLYARYGEKGPHLMFAGHTDVVPTGEEASWTHAPFSAEIDNGEIYGRGAVDMKGGIACFIAAFSSYLSENRNFDGSVSLLITGDEEGPAVNGTEKLLKHAANNGEIWDACIVGEPTNPNELGDMIKIGRRGSMSARVSINGKQGHVAYPHLADNPVTSATALMSALMMPPLDEGTPEFPPTNLEITSVDTGNPALNVISGSTEFQFNIRFNDTWNEESLKAELQQRLKKASEDTSLRQKSEPIEYKVEFINRVSPVFLTKDEKLIQTMQSAVSTAIGKTPDISTTGGTSDARFIKDFCPVIEFGLVGQTMHMIDERAAVSDVEGLAKVYQEFIKQWFG